MARAGDDVAVELEVAAGKKKAVLVEKREGDTRITCIACSSDQGTWSTEKTPLSLSAYGYRMRLVIP